MADLHPRIQAALVSVDPTSKRPAWHGLPTARGVLRGVRAAAAVWRPYPDSNNIREIALHIAFWENSVAGRLSGERVSLGLKMWKTSWVVRSDSVSEAQWKDEVELLKLAHTRLVEAVTQLDPDRLDQPPGPQTDRKAVEYIHGVAEHSLYHAAQMEMIKKLVEKA